MPRRKRLSVPRDYGVPYPYPVGLKNFSIELSEEGRNRIVIRNHLDVIRDIREMDGTNEQFCRYLDREFGIFIKIED